jgi:MYXO-CTERM domain-containing protein
MRILALSLLTFPTTALAYSTGKTGSSTAGCTTCHGSAADKTTTVGFSLDSSTVAPGDTVTVQFSVATTDSSRTAGGLNVTVSDGTLAAGSNTQAKSGEITHSASTGMTDGEVVFDFTFTAPSTEGDVTLYGAGNAVNENAASSGDGWNITTLTLTVADSCSDADGDTVTDCDGDCDDKDPSVYPGADEVCNDLDDDCNDITDDYPVDGNDYFADVDGDGFGDSEDWITACAPSDDWVDDDTDCDDTDSSVNPGATETWYDGIDQDCADDDDYDQDGDGVGVDSDCDDEDATVSAPEDCKGGDDSGGTDSGGDGGTDSDGGTDGDGGSTGDDGSDTGDTGDGSAKAGCACSTGNAGGGVFALLGGFLVLALRRRRA